MSEFISNPNNPLSNVKGAVANTTITNSEVSAKNALKVFVTDIRQNQVTLSNSLTNQSINIPTTQFSAPNTLAIGQSYALRTVDSASTLTNKNNSQVGYILVPINSDGKSIITGNITSSSRSINSQINLTSEQLSAFLKALQVLTNSKSALEKTVTLQALILKIQGNQITLSVNIGNQNVAKQAQVNLTLPNQIVQALKVGQNVAVSLQIKGDEAKVINLNVSPNTNQSDPNQRKISSALENALIKQTKSLVFSKTQLSEIKKVINQQNPVINASQQATGPQYLNQKLLEQLPRNIQNTIQSVLQTQPNILNLFKTSGISFAIDQSRPQAQLIVNTIENRVNLNVKQSSVLVPGLPFSKSPSNTENIDLSSFSMSQKQKPVAPEKALSVNRSQTDDVLVYSKSNIAKSNLSESTSQESAKTEDVLMQNTKPIQTKDSQIFRPSQKILEQLLLIIDKGPYQLKGNMDIQDQQIDKLSSLHQIQAVVQKMGKQALVKTSEQTASFQKIMAALNSSQDVSPELKKTVSSIQELLSNQPTSNSLSDANIIKHILTTPLNPAPTNANANSTQNGFLNALVTMLQVALASRLQKQSNHYASKVQQAIPEIVKNLIPTLGPAQSARFTQDFNQFDTRHLLSAEIAKILANHQQNKLKSADNILSGQDSLYYTLPNLFHKSGKDIELMIKREHGEDDNSKTTATSNNKWMLNMKFDIEGKGEMLAKSLLQNEQIDLQIYTSNTELRDLVLDKLPWLKKRFDSLGLELINRSCQLGKIPDSLDGKHYGVYQTNA